MIKNRAIGINIKQEVDKVENMKNKLVAAKGRINQVIIRGGANNLRH